MTQVEHDRPITEVIGDILVGSLDHQIADLSDQIPSLLQRKDFGGARTAIDESERLTTRQLKVKEFLSRQIEEEEALGIPTTSIIRTVNEVFENPQFEPEAILLASNPDFLRRVLVYAPRDVLTNVLSGLNGEDATIHKDDKTIQTSTVPAQSQGQIDSGEVLNKRFRGQGTVLLIEAALGINRQRAANWTEAVTASFSDRDDLKPEQIPTMVGQSKKSSRTDVERFIDLLKSDPEQFARTRISSQEYRQFIASFRQESLYSSLPEEVLRKVLLYEEGHEEAYAQLQESIDQMQNSPSTLVKNNTDLENSNLAAENLPFLVDINREDLRIIIKSLEEAREVTDPRGNRIDVFRARSLNELIALIWERQFRGLNVPQRDQKIAYESWEEKHELLVNQIVDRIELARQYMARGFDLPTSLERKMGDWNNFEKWTNLIIRERNECISLLSSEEIRQVMLRRPGWDNLEEIKERVFTRRSAQSENAVITPRDQILTNGIQHKDSQKKN